MKANTPTIDAMTRVASPQIHPKPNGRFILRPPCCLALILGSTCEGPVNGPRGNYGGCGFDYEGLVTTSQTVLPQLGAARLEAAGLVDLQRTSPPQSNGGGPAD